MPEALTEAGTSGPSLNAMGSCTARVIRREQERWRWHDREGPDNDLSSSPTAEPTGDELNAFLTALPKQGNWRVKERFSRSWGWRCTAAVMGAAAACLVMGIGVQPEPVHAEAAAPQSIGDDPPARECDSLSADPADASRPAGVRGVYFASLDAASAVTACRAALARFLDSARILSELGRALVKARAYDEAFTLLKRAAEDGYAQAEADIGELYEDGLGAKQDYARAMAWYQKAADQNNPDGQNDIGALYEHAHGINQDYAQSMAWRRKAADQGYAAALNDSWLYEHGFGVINDYAEAMAWYQKAADQDYPTAARKIGRLFQEGDTVGKDVAKARAWYRKAADQGDQAAKDALMRLAE